MKQILGLFILLFMGQSLFATHNLAGDITYRHISGLTYEFTVTIFSDGNSPAIERREIEINWGDNTGLDSLTIAEQTQVGTNDFPIFKRVWRGTHTFPGGAFTFKISVEDPNRNANVVNMDNSINVPFTIETELTISPFSSTPNNSVQLRNDPLDDACTGARYEYNPGAFDPDGIDSIAYRLAPSKAARNITAPGYFFPAASDSIVVDPITGNLIWDSPTTPGLHNVAILIIEYRNGIKIGSVLRDIQINVIAGCNNNPPNILADQLVCVEAGNTLNTTILGQDSDGVDDVTLSATGEVLEPPIASRTVFNSGIVGNPTSASFIWNTECVDVRKRTYQLSIKAEDNASDRANIPNLVSFRNIDIRVISPAPKNVSATEFGNTITVSWTNTDCQNAVGYYVYRRLDSSGFVPSNCIPGVPEGIGYQKVATIDNVNTTSFTDTNDGEGFVPGQKYCYLVTKFFTDEDESYASAEVCAEIDKIVPVITNVSVQSTDETAGIINLAWSPPASFDAVAFPPPYRYVIYSIENNISAVIDSTNSINDTTYTVQNINTETEGHTYRVDLYSLGNGRQLLGRSTKASSMFLTIIPSDNQLTLNWSVNVPWKNSSYTIFRNIPSLSTNFDSIGVTQNLSFVDTSVLNGTNYCYFIRSTGAYNLTSVINPIINLSQEDCAIPVDDVPPCPPVLAVMSDCEMGLLELSWGLFQNNCPLDVAGYNIYKSETLAGDLVLIETRNSPSDTVFNAPSDSIGGCYVVTAFDGVGNESAFSEKECIEYCPNYELPNVFTPNGDGINDFFIPIQPYKDVDSIQLVIYNRWGEEVFSTNDPDIRWNGEHNNIKINEVKDIVKLDGKLVSPGVYYYVCEVYELSLEPNEPRILKGTVTILSPEPTKENQ